MFLFLLPSRFRIFKKFKDYLFNYLKLYVRLTENLIHIMKTIHFENFFIFNGYKISFGKMVRFKRSFIYEYI